MKTEIDRLTAEEEQAGLSREYEQAAILKSKRLQLETEFNQEREQWQHEKNIDEVVDEGDIAAVVAQWTGIPVAQMMETEARNCCTWKSVCTTASSGRRKRSRR